MWKGEREWTMDDGRIRTSIICIYTALQPTWRDMLGTSSKYIPSPRLSKHLLPGQTQDQSISLRSRYAVFPPARTSTPLYTANTPLHVNGPSLPHSAPVKPYNIHLAMHSTPHVYIEIQYISSTLTNGNTNIFHRNLQIPTININTPR